MNRILVALDDTDNAPFVLARAIELGTALGAKLRLLSAVQVPAIATAAPTGPVYVDPSVLTVAAEARLHDSEERVPAALRDGTVAQIGSPSDVICSVARAYDADLVVIGAHRHGLIARALGTTAASVVNHIDRPVMVVKPAPAPAPA
ncbi:MAG TPA: universal stress protein [Labilithrix sp.]|nr:universal stress protein [Labilithrix sp.]